VGIICRGAGGKTTEALLSYDGCASELSRSEAAL
jgi:hypothetical protein